MDDKDLVKDKSNISDIIQGYLELKPAGSARFKALCPFHHEKTPSLHISDEKQIWHCFGCGKGGDVFSFIMEMQGVDFREALEQLANKAGITLTQKTPQDQGQKKSVLTMNEQACRFFETVLHDHALGEDGRMYLKNRFIDLELAKKFRLGYAPKSWDALVRVFGKHGIDGARLIKSGLAKKGSTGNTIDLFRERITIPIRDIQGQVIGFTGRALVADQYGPKYLNSPETEVFKKRSILYGLYEARTAIRLENKVIITEGNLDVIASHKAGIEYIVASSGTALTDEQIIILKRLTENILFCFDADSAGFKASQKGIHVAQKQGVRVKVIRIPRDLGKDPDDVIQKNPEAWREIVQNPIHIMQFYIEELLRTRDIHNAEQMSDFIKEIAHEIIYLQDTVERTYWLQRIADMTHIALPIIVSEVKRIAGNISTDPTVQTQKTVSVLPHIDRAELLFWEIVCLIVEHGFSLRDELKEEDIPMSFRELYRNMLSLYDGAVASADPHTFKQQLLAHYITPEASHVRAIMLRIEEERLAPEHNARIELQRHVASLTHIARDERKQRLEADIRIAEQDGNQEQLQSLLREYQRLI